MLRIFLALLVALTLTACGTFGHAAYTVTNTAQGCDLAVQDGKEFAGRRLEFDGKGCRFAVIEQDAKAFAGQAIGAKTMTVLPVTGLDKLVPAQ